MKPVWVFVILSLILCAATSLVFLNLSLSSYHKVLGLSSSHLFVFSMFNTVIGVLFAQSYKPSTDVFDELEEEQTKEIHNVYKHEDYDDDDENVDYDGDYYDSDGYDEDDDDDGSDGVVGWEDDDEVEEEEEEEEEDDDDDDLESKVEEFIAKVIKGWKEEQIMEEKFHKYVD